MHTITMLAPKGGAGRTTTTMALASGFLALCKRVAVIDCTDQAGSDPDGSSPSVLQIWMKQMLASNISPSQLELIGCRTFDAMRDTMAGIERTGVDVVLIDTAARLSDPQLVAHERADLIIAPAAAQFDAKHIVKGIDKRLSHPGHLMGLVSGCRHGAVGAAQIRDAFDHHPVLQTELEYSETFENLIENGDISHLVSTLSCERNQQGYARFREAQATWVAVQQLTFEVMWALDHKLLEDFEPNESILTYLRRPLA